MWKTLGIYHKNPNNYYRPFLVILYCQETNGNQIKKCTHDAPNMITTRAIMIGRDRDFNHVEDS